MTDIRSYLSDHPDATITEVAFACRLTVPEARVEMARQHSPEPATTARSAPMVSETPDDTPDSDTGVLGHPSGADRKQDAAWLKRTLKRAGVMDLHDAAQYLQIARPSIELAVAKGALPYLRIGSTERGKKLFTKADLDAYRARHPRNHHPQGRSSV